METQPPFPVVSGQRQLAAIMFTDAVGYSARMHEEEVATLNRIERDAEAKRRIVESHAGLVLKSTGDGLLIQFASAVEAVACALEIQRYFASRLAAGVATSALRYRIGIHLGDVFVSNGDVMGDGVNIAARLVNEAAPGGIVISRMVYDVVKNKLPLHVVSTGPQQLKNIKDPVALYRVLLDAPAPSTPLAAAVPGPVPAPARAWKLIGGLPLLLGLAVMARYFLRERSAHQQELQESQSAHVALGQVLKESAIADPSRPGPAAARAPGYDFAALTTRVAAVPDAPAFAPAEKNTRILEAWLAANLVRYTKDRPLSVRGWGDASFQGTLLFLDANHQFHFTEGGASRRRDWSELKESVQAAIIVSALADAPAPPEVREGAAAYAYLHGLPEMIAELRR